jgi:hypothetical protein
MIGLDISTLCKTMHDAVIVTRNLQIQYLWIDALCIIQDDPVDWKREAMSMSEVYAQSAITIAATSSSDSDGGLFFRRPPVPTAQLLWTFSDGSPPERVSFRSSRPLREILLLEHSPLAKRGWVLQESKLSKRTLHFTTDRLFWNCQEVALEEGTTRYHSVDRFNEYAPEVANGLKAFSGPLAQWDLYDTWKNTVHDYTCMHLTYKTDRLPALAGLAKIYAQASNDRYVAGCWQKNLHLYLLWRAELPLTDTSVPLQPSWSWVSYDGPVYFNLMPKFDEAVSLVNEIVVTINGSSTFSSYGEVEEGILELTGRIKATVYDKEGAGVFGLPWDMALDEKHHYGYKYAYFDRTPKLGGTLIILRLCEWEGVMTWTEYVILLEPVEGEAYFKRVGLGKIRYTRLKWEWRGNSMRHVDMIKESWFDDVPDVRVKIY